MRKGSPSIDQLQRIIVARALRVFLVLAILATIALSIRFYFFGETSTLYVVLGVDLLFTILLIFKKSIPYQLIAGILILVIFVVLATGLWRFGVLAAAIFYIALVPIFTYLMSTYQKALIALASSALIFAAFALAHNQHWLEITLDVNEYVHNPVSWVLSGSIVFFSSYAILDIVHQYRKGIESSYKNVEDHRDKLELSVKRKTEDLIAVNKALKESNQQLNQKLEELNLAQDQLLEKEKLASLGFLTAGIAHEIKNPLNYISSSQQLLSAKLEEEGHDDDEVKQLLSFIEIGSEKMNGIIKGLNHFSRSQDRFDEVCQLDEIIDSCLNMLQHLFKGGIAIHKNFPNFIPSLNGNVGKLHQVFTNILSNAAQAIGQEGDILIKIQVLETNLVVSIKDSGSGIAAENLQRILEPFFTTKAPGQGTGLGLSITRSIIEEHQGDLAIDSELNVGTTVTVSLPYKASL